MHGSLLCSQLSGQLSMVRGADDSSLVAVIGAGLAGLVAGATAARAGAGVVIFDGRSPGGRARTDLRDGFRLNQGPHAFFNGGPGGAVLSRLSIRPEDICHPSKAAARSSKASPTASSHGAHCAPAPRLKSDGP